MTLHARFSPPPFNGAFPHPIMNAQSILLLCAMTAQLAAQQPIKASPQGTPPTGDPPVLRLAPPLAAAPQPGPVTSAVPVGVSRPFASPALRLNNANRDALDEPLRGRPLPRQPDPSGALLRSLGGDGSWRGFVEAFNPLAPIPPEMRKVRYVHEMNRPVDHGYPRSLRDPLTPSIPRAFQDPITHEPSLRLW